jgi:hypothetical protein
MPAPDNHLSGTKIAFGLKRHFPYLAIGDTALHPGKDLARCTPIITYWIYPVLRLDTLSFQNRASLFAPLSSWNNEWQALPATLFPSYDGECSDFPLVCTSDCLTLNDIYYIILLIKNQLLEKCLFIHIICLNPIVDFATKIVFYVEFA